MARTDERPPGRADDATPDPPGRRPAGVAGPREFVAIVATCMAMAALSIDLMLPAFPEMREAFGLEPGSTEVSLVITAFFLGLAAGQLVYGPLSDRYGRKPLLYVGLVDLRRSAPAAPAVIAHADRHRGLPGAVGPRGRRAPLPRPGHDPRPLRGRPHGPDHVPRHGHVHPRARVRPERRRRRHARGPVADGDVGAGGRRLPAGAVDVRRLPETLPPADRRSVAPVRVARGAASRCCAAARRWPSGSPSRACSG